MNANHKYICRQQWDPDNERFAIAIRLYVRVVGMRVDGKGTLQYCHYSRSELILKLHLSTCTNSRPSAAKVSLE
eukprot:4536848-Amphidinium_carterae.2